MKRKKKKKTLRLNRITIRALSGRELGQAGGGALTDTNGETDTLQGPTGGSQPTCK